MERATRPGGTRGEGRRKTAAGAKLSQPISRILIAVDLADSADPVPWDALNAAHQRRHHGGPGAAPRLVAETIPLAQALGASIEIVYVRETPSRAPVGPRDIDAVDDWVDRRLDEMAESAAAAGVACMTTSLQGSMRRALVAHVKKTMPDLVVLGSYTRWHLVETCAQHILRDAHRRILVVPIDDPETSRSSDSD
jgi:nucleotide-binding universal stress UspA family protein